MVQRGADYERQSRDWYRTPSGPVHALMNIIEFDRSICDPCCGDGAMMEVFRARGHEALGLDIQPMAVPSAHTLDFVRDEFPFEGPLDIVTNPPYGDKRATLALAFISRALEVTKPWNGRVAMLLPVDFDSAKTRTALFKDHPAFAHRVTLLKRIVWFEPEEGKSSSPAANSTWFVWDWARHGRAQVHYASW